MKKECFKNLPKLKKETSSVAASFKQSLDAIYQRIQRDFQTIDCIKLESNLSCLKDVKPLQKELKTSIFKFFLQKQLKQFDFLKPKSQTNLRILKLTKIKLENYNLDWLVIWKDILEKYPQISRKSVSSLQQFLKILKIFFNENNCMDVIRYFLKHHALHKEFLFNYILIFANITANTKEQLFNQFLQQLIQCYYRGLIKGKNLIIYFINLMKKRKNVSLSQNRYNLFNDIILSLIISPSSGKEAKDSIQGKFTKETALMISQFVGKQNPNSMQLLTYIFKIVQKFINPFENSSKAVRFLFNLIRFLWKRKQRQQNAKERLNKLQQKTNDKKMQLNKLKEQSKQQNKLQKIYQQQTTQENINTKQQNQLNKQQQNNEGKQKQNINEQDQQQEQGQVQSDQQKDKQECIDEQLNQGEQQQLFFNPQEKKNKYLKILKNQLTPEIYSLIKKTIQNVIQSIYFVNSVKTVPQFIRYSFMFVPNLVIRSLDFLDKASEIPYINEQGLVLNIKITAQFFMSQGIQKDSINNVMRILQRIINCSKMRQVWPIYMIFCSKIPLLDEKDLQLVSSQKKEYFEQKFGLNHDRFYQSYSDNVLEAFKRLLRQGQFFDKATSIQFYNSFEELYSNSYNFYRKRLLNQVIEIITQNRKNQFVFRFFKQKIAISPNIKEIILEQLNLIEQDNLNQQSLQLRSNLVEILCHCQPLKELKKYIRQFARKNKYQIIKSFFFKRVQFILLVQPLNSDLKYFFQAQTVNFKLSETYQNRIHALNQLREYSEQLLLELYQLVFSKEGSTELQKATIKLIQEGKSIDSVSNRIKKMYCSKQNEKLQFNNIQNRKKISEILMLILSIQQKITHEVIKIDQTTLKIQFVPLQRQRKSLLQNEKFIQIVKALIFLKQEEYIHDPVLITNLSALISHQLNFNYPNQGKLQKQNFMKCTHENNHNQIPKRFNKLNMIQCFSSKIKVLYNYSLMNKCKKLTGKQQNSNIILRPYIQSILNDLKILSLAPGNQKSGQVIKIFFWASKTKNFQDFILFIYNLELDNRFFWEKCFNLFDQFKNYGLNFNSVQIVQLIKNHIKGLQSKHKKVRQIALKSFQCLLSILPHNNAQEIEKYFRQNMNSQKQQIIWIMAINILISSKYLSHKISQKDTYQLLNKIYGFMKILQKLILSQTRIIRRLSLFLYSICFRKSKKLVMYTQTKLIQQSKTAYQPKKFSHFLQYGYLRQQHEKLIQQKFAKKVKSENSHQKYQKIKGIQKLRKLGPYNQYQVAIVQQSQQNKCYEIFSKIQQESFCFLLDNSETLLKFLNYFHSDMASTAQQLLSMAQQIYKPVQISDLSVKQLQQTFYFLKLKDLHYGRIQMLFGQRFFKYLIQKDSKHQFKFVTDQKVKQLICKALQNMQSLDNQAFVLVICVNLLNAYQKSFDTLNLKVKQSVEQILLLIFNQGISKFSGTIFKKLVLMIDKIKNLRALQFLEKKTLHSIFQSKKYICRNATIYLAIHENNLQKHIEILKVLFQNKLQLQNSFVNKLINSILSFPQKWPLEKLQIQKYKFIDFDQLRESGQLLPYTQRTYHYSNIKFNSYLIQSFKKFVLTESQQKNNQILKIYYGMILNAINCYSHLFQCPNNTNAIIDLIQLVLKLMENKDETQLIDLQQFQQHLKSILSNPFQHQENFQHILKTIMNFIKKSSAKRQVQYISIIAHRPYNFLKLTENIYDELIYDFLEIQEKNVNYKQLMTSLSVMLSFRMVNIQKFVDLIIERHQIKITQKQSNLSLKINQISKNKQAKSKIVLLYQAHQLSTLTLNETQIQLIMKHSNKEKKNIWSREMLLLRGKKQYLDNEETKTIWRSIKEFSNPYHYIA